MHAQGQIDLPEKDVTILWTRPHSPVFKAGMQMQAGCGLECKKVPLLRVMYRAGGRILQGVCFRFGTVLTRFPASYWTQHAASKTPLRFA